MRIDWAGGKTGTAGDPAGDGKTKSTSVITRIYKPRDALSYKVMG